jgi:hypothetical protein
MPLESASGGKPLAFFTDQMGVKDRPVMPMLHPFLGCPAMDGRDPNRGKFQNYYAAAHRLFARVERPAAQIAVLPWDWDLVKDHPDWARQSRRFIRENVAAGLKTVVFSESDPETAMYEPGIILFRTSLVGRKVRPHEQAMPAWALGEPNLKMADLTLREFRARPSVGFCGASYRNNFRQPNWFRRTFRPWRCRYERVYPRKPGLRGHIIDLLRASAAVDTKILERDGFFGGCWKDGKFNMEAFPMVRQEYVHNLLGSDYALCARGGGNFSYRFYDALQLGCIPLFINTDCVLPWAEYISWRSLCVWVELAEVDRVCEILLSHHTGLDRRKFEDRQRQCRAVWEKHLSPEGFFATLRGWLADHGHCRQVCK